MIDAQSLAAGLVLAAELLTRRRAAADGEPLGPLDVTASPWGELPSVNELAAALGTQASPPELLSNGKIVPATAPIKIAEANPSPRRTVIIQNRHTTARVRIAERGEKLAGANSGIELAPGDTLINDPPYPHAGEWWAISDTANTPITVAEST